MGTYLTVKIMDENQQVIERIHTLKGSVGSYSYAFDEESIDFKKGEYLHYKMPVWKALANLKEVKNDVINNIIEEKLDDWSREALKGKLKHLHEAINKMESYKEKDYFLFCDESEYLWIYDKEEAEVPYSERQKHWESFRHLAQGLNFGKYLNPEQKTMQQLEHKNLMKLLEQQDWIEKIEYYGSTYDPHHLVIGDNIMNRFVCMIHSPLLVRKDDVVEHLDAQNEIRMKLKSLLLPLDVSIDENIHSKYNHSLYEFKEGIRKLMKEENIENEALKEYLFNNYISAFDYKNGQVFMEFYTKFNNAKLQALSLVEN